MNSPFYQRELSEAEKKYVANKLIANEEAQLIIEYFSERGFIQRDSFDVTKSIQLQTETESGTVSEVSLGNDVFIWYSHFNHLKIPNAIEKVTGVVVKDNKEQQFEVDNGEVKLINETIVLEANHDDDRFITQDNCFVHGNWCGPGCSGPSDPIDDLDACCMVHDKCYEREGYFNCQCDIDVIECTNGIPGWKAFMVRAYFIAAQVAGFCA
ncbi:hypothetical protein [Paenibacillus apiarius]|uniref:hypothetical protein n=1 Tax=Paenibacillus apiarius TaxID=46240 RepID=UPI001980AEF4|nr:hypothetical protein [Paenibacillus apiarius]